MATYLKQILIIPITQEASFIAELSILMRIYLPSRQIFELYAPVHGRLSIPTFYLLQAAPPRRGQVKINIYSSCWSSPRKSLVKGERFVRE